MKVKAYKTFYVNILASMQRLEMHYRKHKQITVSRDGLEQGDSKFP
jgi:hypothetical protein